MNFFVSLMAKKIKETKTPIAIEKRISASFWTSYTGPKGIATVTTPWLANEKSEMTKRKRTNKKIDNLPISDDNLFSA
jgi:hypothetical protein